VLQSLLAACLCFCCNLGTHTLSGSQHWQAARMGDECVLLLLLQCMAVAGAVAVLPWLVCSAGWLAVLLAIACSTSTSSGS
jgi:hypothetical protein